MMCEEKGKRQPKVYASGKDGLSYYEDGKWVKVEEEKDAVDRSIHHGS